MTERIQEEAPRFDYAPGAPGACKWCGVVGEPLGRYGYCEVCCEAHHEDDERRSKRWWEQYKAERSRRETVLRDAAIESRFGGRDPEPDWWN